MEKLGKIISRILYTNKKINTADFKGGTYHWKKSAGERLSGITEFIGLRENSILITISHPVAAQEIKLCEKEILKKFNASIKGRIYSSIIILSRKKGKVSILE